MTTTATTTAPAAPIGSSLLQIIKVNALKTGVKDGRTWELQDTECILLNEDGSFSQVGVLVLPKEYRGDNAPPVGIYRGEFILQPDLRSRRIEAKLVALHPVKGMRTPLSMPSAASPADK